VLPIFSLLLPFRRLLLAGLAIGIVLPATARERLSFDGGWRFHLGEVAGGWEPGLDTAAWQPVDLPHDWSIAAPVAAAAPSGGDGGYFRTGVGWYRREFVAPATGRDRRLSLEFEGVYMNATVWLNGAQIAFQACGYTTFSVDITRYIRFGADNVLAVRVDNSQQPNCRWYSGSGIYRHVWLHVTAPVHLAAGTVCVTTTDLAPDSAALTVQAAVRNDTAGTVSVELRTTIVAPDGREVAATVPTVAQVAPGAELPVSASLTLPCPDLWSPERPALHRAVTQVRAGGRVVDEVATSFGVRTVRVSAARGFELNGRTIELVGGSVHHDQGVLGAAAFDRAEERKVELLKAAGFNAVRTAHNPPSPAFLDACDRHGLLVIDEAFDGWRKSKTPHDYGTLFDAWWRRDLEAMIRRDRNHPSVVLWSIGNEVFERGTPEGAEIARALTACIRTLDASRPVTAGLNGMGADGDWTKVDPVFATLDVAGYNYELGRQAADHARLPSRVIVAAESYQSETFANWAVVHDQPHVIGDFVWSALDYLGEAGIGRVFPPDEPVVKHWEGVQFPWHGAYCGDLDLTGWRKPVSHYRAIVWDRGERLHAAVLAPTSDGRAWNLSPWSMPPALPSWTWPGQEGKPLTVEVYSRHEAVRLLLDGRPVGEKPTTRAEEFKAVFSVSYAPGRLEAVGIDGGRETERFTLVTAGPAVQLRLTADRTQLRADGQDLAFVTVEVVDTQGVVVTPSAASVSCSVDGAGTLAGVGNGDPTTLETCQADPHRVFQGRSLVVVRTRGQPGPIRLTVSSPGLEPAVVTLVTLPSAP
jgi:beta-galactosidase